MHIMLHAKDTIIQEGLSSILLKATDMGILAIYISLFIEIGAKKIQVEYGGSTPCCLFMRYMLLGSYTMQKSPILSFASWM